MMDDLFMIILLVSLGAIFYFRKRDRKKRNISIIVAVASFVLFGLTMDDTEVEETTSDAEPTEQVEEPTETTEDSTEQVEEEPADEAEEESTEQIEEDSTEDPVEEVEEEPENTEAEFANIFEEKANEVFGDNLQEVYEDEAGEATEHYVNITAKISGGWSEQTMRDAFYNDVVKVASEVQNEEFDRIVFDATADMQDQYGNVEESKVLTINLTKETVDKINFDNFTPDNLPNVADAVFVHPAFQG